MLPKQEHPETCKKGHTLAGNVYYSRNASKGATYRRWYCRLCAADRKRAQLTRERVNAP